MDPHAAVHRPTLKFDADARFAIRLTADTASGQRQPDQSQWVPGRTCILEVALSPAYFDTQDSFIYQNDQLFKSIRLH